jgi:ferritin-like metal-binding protein YciE
MIEKAGDSRLRQAFQTHLQETENHIGRLVTVFSMHDEPVKGATCRAIDGIIAEPQEIIGNVDDPQVLDAAMLSSAQAVEHYEITRYGTLFALARQLGREGLRLRLEADSRGGESDRPKVDRTG